MTTTISYAGDTVTPILVDGWTQSRESRNIAHPLIGGGVEFTHTPPMPRTGSMRLLFADEDEAIHADQLHRTAPYLDLVSDDRELVNGRYVVTDTVDLELDDETREIWILTVGYTEDEPT